MTDLALSSVAKLPTLTGSERTGRPTKKTKKLVTELLSAIKDGAPFNLACAAVGIHPDTFGDWRRRDPTFAQQVDQAAAKGALQRLKKIEEHGGENWSALAWMLERRYPQEFSRPEVQLNLAVQNNVAQNANSGGISFQRIVVSDLEFLGLRQHPDYKHHVPERSEREVQSEHVPLELSGTLSKEGQPGVVVSESAAAAKRERLLAIRARTEKLLAARATSAGNGQTAPEQPLPEEPPGASQQSPAVSAAEAVLEPTPRRPLSWWRQFVFGGETAIVPKSDAIECIKLVLTALGVQLNDKVINFASAPVTNAELQKSLTQLTGGQLGWQTLVELYRREFQHGGINYQS